MILRVGTWYSNQNSALHSVLLENVLVRAFNDPEFGKPITVMRSLTVMVHLEDFANQTEVKGAIQTIEAALAADGPDVIMYHDLDSVITTPTVESAHHLKSTQQGSLSRLGSPRLEGYEWLPASDAQYATRRSIRLTFSADYQSAAVAVGTIIRLDDSVSYRGFGGARTRYSQPLTGYPVKVQLQQRTPRYAIQSGRAVVWGQHGYAAPLWPTLLDNPASGLAAGKVQKVNGQDALYNSSWSYVHSGTEDNPTVAGWRQP